MLSRVQYTTVTSIQTAFQSFTCTTITTRVVGAWVCNCSQGTPHAERHVLPSSQLQTEFRRKYAFWSNFPCEFIKSNRNQARGQITMAP